MKYSVRNDLSLFEFHDSIFSFVSFDGNDFVVSVSALNIHKNTPQNTSQYDMEIESAKITFGNFHSVIFEQEKSWERGEDGVFRPVGQRIIYSGKDALNKIKLQNSFTVTDFSTDDQGYFIDAVGIEPFFVLRFDFDEIIIEWDEYKQKAWYELKRYYQFSVKADTAEGIKDLCLHISIFEEEPRKTTISCTYNNINYSAYSDDNNFEYAFADLQRQLLPKGVTFKCCLSCRHGNFCPSGNAFNEIFCTKDVLIKQKSDLYFYTEDEHERKQRIRSYFEFCEDHSEPNAAAFTYNDFFYYLNTHRKEQP